MENLFNRRDFLRIGAAALAAGATGCRRPKRKIVPLVAPVEYQRPGETISYASVFELGGTPESIVVDAIDGRPVKIDGFDFKSGERIGSSPIIQASIYNLYDPERFRRPRFLGAHVKLQVALKNISDKISNGEKTYILQKRHSSPTLARLVSEIEKNFPNAKFVFADDGSALKIEIANICENPANIIFLECDLAYFNPHAFKKFAASKSEEELISISQYPDETAENCGVDVPAAHYLESWGDSGNSKERMICQPVISPLNPESLSLGDALLQIFKGVRGDFLENIEDYYAYLRAAWTDIMPDNTKWEEILKRGGLKIKLDGTIEENSKSGLSNIEKKSILNVDSITASLKTSDSMINGELASNPYLIEFPDVKGEAAWENYARISKNLAKKYSLTDGDEILIKSALAEARFPIFISGEIEDNEIELNNGYGRKIAGKSFGTNPNPLFDKFSENPNMVEVEIEKTGARRELIINKNEFNANLKSDNILTFFDISAQTRFKYKGARWGMAIDLKKCDGCGVCALACQIENNVPFVGPEETRKGRAMHWIKIISAKFEGREYRLPLMCQHCDKAPCESVCPVQASVHSPEGANETVYNRCVGTRYCMANCPYKVRKFNYFDNFEKYKKPLNLMLNPNVTIRSRGVVEKCSFCIHRVNKTRYEAQDAGLERIADGAVKTACQVACSKEAIHFGDLNDPNSQVSRDLQNRKAYVLLGELGTLPSVYYLL